MTKKRIITTLTLCAGLVAGTGMAATQLLDPADNIISVGGHFISKSSYPVAEAPLCVCDQNPATKYLNHGALYTGFIITPNWGASTLQCIQLTTANDESGRDPASYQLYGTNEEIKSTDNSAGDGENWTLISEGALSLPEERGTLGDFISFSNTVSYTSYRLVFPTIKDPTAEMMQVADVQFFEMLKPDFENGDYGILSGADLNCIAIQFAMISDSNYATGDYSLGDLGSVPYYAVDNNPTTRHANYAKTDVGVAIWPISGLTRVESMSFQTFTNLPCCDPMSYQLFGTADIQKSLDKSMGDAEDWVLISSGSIPMPLERSQWSDLVSVNAKEFYRGYKLLFTSLRDAADAQATLMQFAEMRFYGEKTEASYGEKILSGGDVAKPINDLAPSVTYTFGGCPDGEPPVNALDGSVNTKCLNWGGMGAGFILTPASGKSVVKGMKLWTANDSPGRDPATYQLFGTDDPITSQANTKGLNENWTLISEGEIALPEERLSESALFGIENTGAWTSYKLVFPTLKDNTGYMQIADVQLYSDGEGSSPILSTADFILSVSETIYNCVFSVGETESTQFAIDGNSSTKYFNRLGAGSGVIFVPMNSSSIVKAIFLTTANDSVERDPTSYQLFGTNEEVKSLDYGYGKDEEWVLISEGPIELPEARKARIQDPIQFDNDQAYSAYKLLFPTVRGTDAFFQIAEIELCGEIVKAAPKNLLTSEDAFLAVRSAYKPASSYNTAIPESPAMLLDGDSGTKYLNDSNWTNNVGFIITPAVGKTSLMAAEFVTGNDCVGRDPTSYRLYGTDDPITSEDNSDGSQENWVLVSEGTIEPPINRQSTGNLFSLETPTAPYTSWKFVFPTIKGKDADGTERVKFQMADLILYGADWTPIQTSSDFIIAVADYMTGSGYPGQEGPFALADGNIKVKHMNHEGPMSGFIVTPATLITPNAVMYTTANDAPGRDPVNFELYGTDDPITSLDNSAGMDEDWVLIASGPFNTFSDIGIGNFNELNFRFRNSDIVSFDNTKAYRSYKVIFPENKGAVQMQVAEFYFFNIERDLPAEKVFLPYTYLPESNKISFRWAVSYHAQLESAPSTQGPWSVVSEEVVLDNGTCYVEVPMSEKGNSFYRLSAQN